MNLSKINPPDQLCDKIISRLGAIPTQQLRDIVRAGYAIGMNAHTMHIKYTVEKLEGGEAGAAGK